MPRAASNTTKIAFQPGSIMIGRTVKTVTYTPKLVQNISACKIEIADKDIQGWCNLQYTITGVNLKKKTVMLKYTIPGTIHQCANVVWPIEGLSKSFGIRL